MSALVDEWGRPLAGGTPTEGMPLPPDQPADGVPAELSVVLGTSGQKFQGGHSDEEYHTDLSGDRESVIQTLDQMRTGNALLAGPLSRIEAQLRQADWTFSPAPRAEPPPSIRRLRQEHDLEQTDWELEDLEHEVVQFHSSWLLGGPAPEYAMETSWKQQALHEACTFMAFPSALFEVVWRRVDGRYGTKVVPQRLSWLHPRSIRGFKISESGRLLGIVQDSLHGWDDREDESYGGGQSRRHLAFIPADRLLVIARNREGTLPEGTPFARHMYADATRADAAIKWQLVDAQNRAVGIPFIEIPKGANARAVASAKAQARRMTYGNHHLAYVVSTEGIKVGFVDMSASTVNLDAIIKAQERRMRHVTGTEFTALGGDSGSGALALAKVLREEFNVVVQGVNSAIVEDVRRGLIEKVHQLNYGDRLAAPNLEAEYLLAVDPQDLAALVEAKVLPADRDVANVARRSIGLGPIAEATASEIDTSQLNDLAIAKAAVMTGEVINAIHAKLGLPELPPELKERYDKEPVNTPSPAVPGSPGSTRELASLSAAPAEPGGESPSVSKAQLARVKELRELRKALESTIVERLQKLRAEIVREVASRAQVSASRPSRLGGRLAPSKPSRSRFRGLLSAITAELFEHGRQTMREEVVRFAGGQGTQVNLSSVPAEAASEGGIPPRVLDELDLVTELNVNAILNAIEPMLRDAYRRARGLGLAGDEALESAAEEVAGAGVRELERAARQAAGAAVNAGRSVGLGELREELAGEVELDEVTRIHLPGPGAHCEPCRKLEGKRVLIDSDDYDRYEPPKHCLGQERCHCAYLLDLSDD